MSRRSNNEIRLYESVNVVQYMYQPPTMDSKEYEKLKADIAENGMRHPVLIRWDEHSNRFTPRVGNNRVAMLAEQGKTHAKAIVFGPPRSPWPEGEYEVLPWNKHLKSRFDELWSGPSYGFRKEPWRIIVELVKIHKITID